MAEMEKEPPSPKSEFMMAVAGPLASFLLAFVFSRIEALALASNWPVQIIGVTHYLAFVNLIVAVFNLVPAFPLDGGRMLRALLWRTKRSLHDATYIATRIGEGFGIFLMIFGVLAFIQGNFIGGMWWFLIGMFVRGAASASYQQLLLQEVVHDQPVSAFMRVNPIAVPPSITIDKWVEDYVYRHHFKMFPVVKDSELLGCIRVESLGKLSKNDWPDTLVRDLMETSSEANTIAPDTSTMKLLTDMVNGRKHSRYMVVDRGQLVGMISLKDLLELIALKLEIEAPKGAPSD
jgi:CBS domain-containing protein